MARRKRDKYYGPAVVLEVLRIANLLTIAKIVYSAARPLTTKEVSERCKTLGVDIRHTHAANLLRRLERWGLVRCYRHPRGVLIWTPAQRGPARLLRQFFDGHKLRELLQQLEVAQGVVQSNAGCTGEKL